MATVSLCMIVKNEESVLDRCLSSVAHLMDEIIIVDTGSDDATKEIAAKYTDQIYDFTWIGDFSAARNFSFSKATMDYIYAPDADEVLDEQNQRAFAQLKEALLPEIEIVQMKYHTVTEFDTVLNASTEYRPKLFKRLRSFTWIDPVHETVRLDPVVFDSDITITHMPESMHSKRDFGIFENTIARGEILSAKLLQMYATELVKTGEKDDLERASEYFEMVYETVAEPKHRAYAIAVLAKYYLLAENDYKFLKLALKDVAMEPCAEVCYFLGCYYEQMEDVAEASLWFTNAAYETKPVVDLHLGGDAAMEKLLACYDKLSVQSEGESKDYYMSLLAQTKEDLANWSLPEEA